MDTDIGLFCATYGKEIGIIYYDYVIPASYLLSTIALLPIIYKFMKEKDNLKVSKSVYYVTLTFFIFAALTFLTATAWSLAECKSFELSTILNAIGGNTYVIQNTFVTGLLFHRLYKTYNSTKYKLSKIHIILFIICFICSFLVFIIGTVIYAIYRDTFGAYIISLSSIFSIVMTVYIAIVYLYKMYRIYQFSNDSDLLKIITKVSILTFFSTLSTILLFILFSMIPVFIHSIHWGYSITLGVILDVYTNALVILLMFKPFDNYYWILCKSCHPKIHRYVMNDNDNDIKQTEIVIEKSVPSGTTTTSDGTTATSTKLEAIIH